MKRHLIPVLLVVILLGSGCTKETVTPASTPAYMNTVTITGFDARKCACCGGYIGNFRGDTTHRIAPDSLSFLLDNSATELGVDATTTAFPFKLNVDWQEQTPCAGRKVKITKVYR
ncbi:MAG: hypothetical protein JNL32_10250 [Candidatus Kapabacteria bacterium]|nr:hypothetical protein [Candidatus Kapabacteria bacterium]